MGERRPRRSWVGSVARLVVRPWLWPVAVRSATRMARPGWWRRPPFLPLPERAYLRFRLETQYGTDGAPAPEDLVTFLTWCRDQDRRVRSGAGP